MAQFDVYVNPNPASRPSVPFVLDVQSGLIDSLPTRLVMPLSRVGARLAKVPTNLCPVLEVEGEALILMPHLAAPVLARLLRNPVVSLPHSASAVSAAMDAVLSGV
ncbi:MAG: CcdB family protein [Burkholderiaceae bacterium]